MTFPFRKFPECFDLLHASSYDGRSWSLLVISRLQMLRTSRLQDSWFFESRNADGLSYWDFFLKASISAMHPNKWTAQGCFGVFTMEIPNPSFWRDDVSWAPKRSFPPVEISNFAVPKCSCFLSSGFTIYRIRMCRWPFPFWDFSRVLGLTPRVPSRWTVLVVSQVRDLWLQISLTTWNRDCRNTDDFLDVCHVSKQMDG